MHTPFDSRREGRPEQPIAANILMFENAESGLKEAIDQLTWQIRDLAEASDDAIMRVFLGKNDNRDHLLQSEIAVLVTTYVNTRAGKSSGYAEAIDASWNYMERPLALGTVSTAFNAMRDMGFIVRADADQPVVPRVGRRLDRYIITSFGIEALYLALGLAGHLRTHRGMSNQSMFPAAGASE